MRGYNADTMLRLARCTLAQPVALEHFLTRCNRASHGRYEIASAGRLLEHGYGAVTLLVFIAWIVAAVLGWGGCAVVVAPLVVGLAWVASMAASDLRILRSVRRTRAGNCAICGYQIDAVPPPGATAAIATCPECGEEVIVGRAPRAPTDEVPSTVARPPQLESPSADPGHPGPAFLRLTASGR